MTLFAVEKILADPDTSCRKCAGTGWIRERTERGTMLSEPCWYCCGSGLKSVLIGRAKP